VTAAQARVAALLRADGGLLAAAVASTHAPTEETTDPREVAVAAIREGHALHAPGATAGAIVATDDPDLGLLAGDRLYALGLAELAQASDLAAVRVLAGVIADAAAARGAGDEPGAEGAWEQGFRQLAHAARPPERNDR
jgi:hypothetical protein